MLIAWKKITQIYKGEDMKSWYRFEYKGQEINVSRFGTNAQIGKWLDDNNIPQSEFPKVKFVTQMVGEE